MSEAIDVITEEAGKRQSFGDGAGRVLSWQKQQGDMPINHKKAASTAVKRVAALLSSDCADGAGIINQAFTCCYLWRHGANTCIFEE
ncbi:MAG: hypothetical protein ACLSHJ_05805 [Oscillospiraceae bacterium]